MRDNLLQRVRARINIQKSDYKQIVLLFFLFSWAVFTYSTGNKLLGAVVILFLLLVILRVPYSVPVIALVVVLVLFRTPMEDTWSAVVRSNRNAITNPGKALSNLFTPASGLAGVPGQARGALSLLQTHDIDRYRLSDRILQDPLISQRITEVVWPRRIDSASPYLLLFLSEAENYPACTIVAKKKDVALEYCH